MRVGVKQLTEKISFQTAKLIAKNDPTYRLCISHDSYSYIRNTIYTQFYWYLQRYNKYGEWIDVYRSTTHTTGQYPDYDYVQKSDVNGIYRFVVYPKEREG